MDTFGISSLQLLLNKQLHHGSVYEKGDHFGECCLLSSSGLRADAARALTGCELYYLVKEELWQEFLYIEPRMRVDFIHDLFTRVGKTKHCSHKIDSSQTSDDESLDNTITTLCRMSFNILQEIYDYLDSIERDSSNSLQSVAEESTQLFDAETEAGNVPAILPSPYESPKTNRRSALLKKAASGYYKEDLLEYSLPGKRTSPHPSKEALDDELAALVKEETKLRTSQRSNDLYKKRVKLRNRKRSVFSAVAIMTKMRLQDLQSDDNNDPRNLVLAHDDLYGEFDKQDMVAVAVTKFKYLSRKHRDAVRVVRESQDAVAEINELDRKENKSCQKATVPFSHMEMTDVMDIGSY
ncbi:hypothetical protein EON65_25505 [archaeon]|nr:MAG: hypothetical protein EON65_25505 [archaeon]